MVEVSEDRKTQDFSGSTRIDSRGPEWTRLRSPSTEAIAGRFSDMDGMTGSSVGGTGSNPENTAPALIGVR